MDAFATVSTAALHQGFYSVGAEDNSVLSVSGLMDYQWLFLTANADTIYSWTIVDLTSGPMVVCATW